MKQRDEIGELASSFNRMVEDLRAIIRQVQHSATVLAKSGKQLFSLTDNSAEATHEIAAAIEEAAKGTANQVQQVHETQNAVAQLRQAIDQIATGAQEQAQRTEQTTVALQQFS